MKELSNIEKPIILDDLENLLNKYKKRFELSSEIKGNK